MITPWLKQRIYEHIIRRTQWPLPTLYAGLLSAVPEFAWGNDSEPVTSNPNGQEVSYLGYSRPLILESAWGAVVSDTPNRTSTISTQTSIAFPTCRGGFGYARRLAFFDAKVGGNMVFICDTKLSLEIGINVRPRAVAGAVSLQLSGRLTGPARSRILQHAIGRSPWSYTMLYADLFSTAPSDAGTGGTRAAYTGFSQRLLIPESAWEPFGGGAANGEFLASTVSFPTCVAGSVTVNAVGFHDAISSGSVLALPVMSGVPLAVSVGVTPKLVANETAFFG